MTAISWAKAAGPALSPPYGSMRTSGAVLHAPLADPGAPTQACEVRARAVVFGNDLGRTRSPYSRLAARRVYYGPSSRAHLRVGNATISARPVRDCERLRQRLSQV